MLLLSQIPHIIVAAANGLLEADDTYYITAGATTTPPPVQTITSTPIPTSDPTPEPIPVGEQVVDLAMQYLGISYVWGGTTPDGFDCSGLVQYVYSQLGISLSRTSGEQDTNGWAVSRNELKAGDLIFFANRQGVHHVGIYIGDGQFIHAPMTGDVVKITALSERNDYYCARRIVE